MYKIGARRDSDEFYPIIQIFGICECESEKEYDKDYLLSEITRTYKCLLNIIDLCFCVFWFMDDPKDKKQFHIYDVIDYQSNLCESVFNVKEYLQEKYDFVVPKSFVKEFVLKVIPLNEPFYPPIAFESDNNLANFENYVNAKGRFLGGWFYVGHHEIKEFNLKFKKDEWSKQFEQTYNDFEKAGY